MSIVFRAFTTAILLILTSTHARSDDPPSKKPAADLPEIKLLPNPFAFLDGSSVRTREDWDRRRRELKGLFEDYEYGHLPPRPEKVSIIVGGPRTEEDSKVDRQDIELTLKQADRSLLLHVNLTYPHEAKAPVPVIVQAGFGRRPNPAAPAKAGPRPDRLKIFTDRGYAVAELSFQELAVDSKDSRRDTGIYQLFGDQTDAGALMAWAWGMSRVIDFLETQAWIDPKKIVVTGHSRYGKAALVAGAFDERIALTVPSHSGCSGAAPYRFIYGRNEQLHNAVGAFPQWFRTDFNQFVGKVERLPIDQHELSALVAPRALLVTEGTNDIWINPQGSQLTYLAAAKVYEFLGARDKISIRYRPVGHIPSNEDLLDYADHVFFGKPLTDDFGKLAYPEETKGFDWDAPK
jgi:hypothetical protein